MIGGLVLLALMDITAAAGDYCLKFKTTKAGYIFAQVKLEGVADMESMTERDKEYQTTENPVDTCWQQKIEYVMVQGPHADEWKGELLVNTGATGNFERLVTCEYGCRGDFTETHNQIRELLVDLNLNSNCQGIVTCCDGGGECKLKVPQGGGGGKAIIGGTTTAAITTTAAAAATTTDTTAAHKGVVSSVIRPGGLVASLSALVAHILF